MLSAAPIDGIETGVYPRLAGRGAPGASINLLIKNEWGQSYEHALTADAQGRWVYTPAILLGQLTVIGQQSYSYQGNDFIDDEVIIGTYSVGYGLGIEVHAISAEETRIRVTGLASPTKN